MDWIKLVIGANPLSAALLCLFAALLVILAMIKAGKSKRSPDSEEGVSPQLQAALARFETHMRWAEDEIKAMKAKVDPLVIAVATLNVITGALKEKVEEGLDRIDAKLDRALERLLG